MAIFDSISNFVKDNLSTYGLDTNLNNYVRNMLPNICDGRERSKSFEVPTGYAITINYDSPGTGLGQGFIKASMPKQISLTLASNWTPIAGNNTTGGLDSVTEAFGGFALTTNQNKSILKWSGTSPLKLPLDLNFVANNRDEVKKKIYEPILALARLVLPQTNSMGIYTPPGPYPTINIGSGVKMLAGDVGGAKTLASIGGTRINVKIGDYMFLDNVIIERANITFPSILGNINKSEFLETISNIDQSGAATVMSKVSDYLFNTSTMSNMKLAPMRANVQIGISTNEALTADGLIKMFSSFESGFDTQKLADGVETSGGTRSSYYRSSGGQS